MTDEELQAHYRQKGGRHRREYKERRKGMFLFQIWKVAQFLIQGTIPSPMVAMRSTFCRKKSQCEGLQLCTKEFSG